MFVKKTKKYEPKSFKGMRKLLDKLDDDFDKIILSEEDGFDVIYDMITDNQIANKADIKYVLNKLFKYEGKGMIETEPWGLAGTIDIDIANALRNAIRNEIRSENFFKNIKNVIHYMIKTNRFLWEPDVVIEYDEHFKDPYLRRNLIENTEKLPNILHKLQFNEEQFDLISYIFDNGYDINSKELVYKYLSGEEKKEYKLWLESAYRKWVASKALDTSIAFRGSGLPSLVVENILSHTYDTRAMTGYELMSIIDPITNYTRPNTIGATNNFYDGVEYIDL